MNYFISMWFNTRSLIRTVKWMFWSINTFTHQGIAKNKFSKYKCEELIHKKYSNINFMTFIVFEWDRRYGYKFVFRVLQGSKLELIGNKYVAEKLLNLIQVVTARVILRIEGFIYFGIYHSIFVRNSSHRFIRLLVCNWTLRHFRSTQH